MTVVTGAMTVVTGAMAVVTRAVTGRHGRHDRDDAAMTAAMPHQPMGR
ncbi:hypothetical protein [Streptomyces neyagawaensis]|nr:hypothetical protein [Streptomyces neyagawaensis]MCL6736097.1 hypothetical protein [Streptomyces neyagawaensis]MDE1684081.1 hypothetical protein [Streptomyces neyagawaensis]